MQNPNERHAIRAARIDRYGGADVINVVADADRPVVARGQLIVEVWASSLNTIDTVLRADHLHGIIPLHFPATLGDFAGVVSEVGPNTKGFSRDDEVYGQANALLGGSGALAEMVAASASMTALKPKTVDCRTAARHQGITPGVDTIDLHVDARCSGRSTRG